MSIRLIVSPAKKMNVVEGPPYASGRPKLLPRSIELARVLGGLDLAASKRLWECSDALAQVNFERTRTLDQDIQADPATLTPAILAYEGIQYQHISPQVMTGEEIAWLQSSLRILSGLYGVLRPLDGVVPYRLEMQAKLSVGDSANLYQYWGNSLYEEVVADGGHIVNLASVEYSKAVLPYARREGFPVTTCLFGTVRESDGKLVQRSTEAKAARGTMVRWCAERNIQDVDDLKAFDERGYAFDEARSESDSLVFVSRP